eukprot:TRINITY_DN80914_c0_g1_i1.p1 TRINITY_DN80914_c0_g1~~TRINITY_DN80914_c0_g1_i1.p1  ORF type:complete len:422 (-),score=44.06 TRINITY_DN80914_c0_g1_i1:115-1347(-)
MSVDDSPLGPFVLYFCLTVLYGLVNSLTSPALPDLAQQASLGSIGLGSLFIPRGIGSIIGAFVIGTVLDAVRDPHKVLAAVLLFRASMELLMPVGWTLELVGLNLACVAFCGNAIYVCGATCISWTYGKLMGPKVSLMDSAFGCGGTFAPALAGALANYGYSAVEGYRVIAVADITLAASTFLIKAKPNPKLAKVETNSEATAASGSGYKPLADGSETVEEHVSWTAVFMCCTIVLFSDVCTSANLFWFYSYATEHLELEHKAARLLNTAFWIGFTSMQFIYAWLQRSHDAATILKCMLPVMLVMALILAVPPTFVGPWVPAIGMVGLSMGGGVNALSTTLLRQTSFISGKALGVIRIASASGNMLGGASVGWVQPWLGRLALPCVATVSMVVNLICLALLLYVRSRSRS